MSSRIQSLGVIAAITGAVSFIGAGSGQAPQAMAAESQKSAAIFAPIIPQLKDSKTPVYLPASLPTWDMKTYPSATLGDSEYPAGYTVTVAVTPDTPSNADTLFYLSAGKGPVHIEKGSGKVVLANGQESYYFGGGNFHTLDWAVGKYCYHIAIYKPQAELVKIANSMVLVN